MLLAVPDCVRVWLCVSDGVPVVDAVAPWEALCVSEADCVEDGVPVPLSVTV